MTKPQHVIRPRRAEDDPQIAGVITAAFKNKAEAALVRRLREDGDMICERVALIGDTIVGHIAFSRLTVISGPNTLRASALAPLAVAPDRQNEGIGDAVTRAALAVLCSEGEDLAVVLGHPNYYARFGFSAVLAKLLDAPYAGDAFMALELKPGALQSLRWNVTYPRAFSSPARQS